MNTAALLAMNEETATNDSFEWSDDVSTFGDRLARARDHAGMNQSDLARRLGVKAVTIKNWETDRSEPRANRLQMLSGLLNVSIIWLMTGEGEGVPETEDVSAESADMRDLLTDLRNLRVEQNRLADRAGLIEKRLRALIAGS